jgi:hypothetical protein
MYRAVAGSNYVKWAGPDLVEVLLDVGPNGIMISA